MTKLDCFTVHPGEGMTFTFSSSDSSFTTSIIPFEMCKKIALTMIAGSFTLSFIDDIFDNIHDRDILKSITVEGNEETILETGNAIHKMLPPEYQSVILASLTGLDSLFS